MKRWFTPICAILRLGLVAATPAFAQPQERAVPEIRFRIGGEELVQSVYSEALAAPGVVDADVRWVFDHTREFVSWWRVEGPVFLARVSEYAGLEWPYREIDVYLVRYWPVVSIEYPLVIAFDAVRTELGEVRVPDDADTRVLLLAHQITHYLLDVPHFVFEADRDPAYRHPFLQPGNFDVEAMVNWVVYRALDDLWGNRRLGGVTDGELWRSYNPNHDYVIDELQSRHRLSGAAPLSAWLAENPLGSEIFRAREAYLRRASTPVAVPDETRETLAGTDYGLDLGASFQGTVFVAFVDGGSPAELAGVQQGDVLRTIEGREVGQDVAEAKRRLTESWSENGEINISVERGGSEIFLSIKEP